MITKKLTVEFNKIKDQIQEVYVAVSMITPKMFDFFIRNTPALGAERVKVVTGVHLPTPLSVFQTMKQKSDDRLMEGRVFLKNFFHQKIYLFKVSNKWKAFVGSGNFTNGGWFENEELFVVIEDDGTCKELLKQFQIWFDESTAVTDDFLEAYSVVLASNQARQVENQKTIEDLVSYLKGSFDISKIDFHGHFFSREHHDALSIENAYKNDALTLMKRSALRDRLFDLNAVIATSFPNTWDIHEHYIQEHIVAHVENEHHHEGRVSSLWVAYGRNKSSLKEYLIEEATPLNFMRLQVIVHHDDVGIWLMPGKKGGGYFDRDNLQTKLKDNNQRQMFFTLCKALPANYWISVAGEDKDFTEFTSAEELYNFVRQDDYRNYYFIIGKDYKVGAVELLETNIKNTVLTGFSELIPLYEFIKHTLN